MKYVTITKAGKTFPVLFPGYVGHKEIVEMLGSPEVSGAGFVTLPEEIKPRVVGESPSLRLGPTNLDASLVDTGFKLTAREYPYAPLFDSITPH